MVDDFRLWDFGDKKYAVTAWTEDAHGYAIRAQRMIQEVMPYDFQPTGEDGIFWFLTFRKRIKVLEDAQLLEMMTPWLHEMIRYAYIPGYKIRPEFDRVPQIIVDLETDPNFNFTV